MFVVNNNYNLYSKLILYKIPTLCLKKLTIICVNNLSFFFLFSYSLLSVIIFRTHFVITY